MLQSQALVCAVPWPPWALAWPAWPVWPWPGYLLALHTGPDLGPCLLAPCFVSPVQAGENIPCGLHLVHTVLVHGWLVVLLSQVFELRQFDLSLGLTAAFAGSWVEAAYVKFDGIRKPPILCMLPLVLMHDIP